MSECTIKELNARGEGVGVGDEGRPLLIPFTLPEERVKYRLKEALQPQETPRAWPEAIVVASPHRQSAPCPYFTRCGGCLLQHMDQESYKDFKINLVRRAFHPHPVEIASFEKLPPGERHRINFKALKKNGFVTLGLHQYRSHHLEPIDVCLLLTPRLNALIAPLQVALAPLLNDQEEANIFLTEGTNGIDMLIDRSLSKRSRELPLLACEKLIESARAHSVIRITLRHQGEDELLYQVEEPFLTLKGHRLYIPPNPFLQTSVRAATHMITILETLMPKRVTHIADLFAGLGTFSFSFSNRAPVAAFESNSSAVHFLNYSASKQKTPYRVQAQPRDLFKYPLSESELRDFDVVALNPPRAGASAQVKKLCAAQVPAIIMISCNVHTFARDAQLLMRAGYKMSPLHLVDQFLWSPHVEVIAGFQL